MSYPYQYFFPSLQNFFNFYFQDDEDDKDNVLHASTSDKPEQSGSGDLLMPPGNDVTRLPEQNDSTLLDIKSEEESEDNRVTEGESFENAFYWKQSNPQNWGSIGGCGVSRNVPQIQ